MAPFNNVVSVFLFVLLGVVTIQSGALAQSVSMSNSPTLFDEPADLEADCAAWDVTANVGLWFATITIDSSYSLDVPATSTNVECTFYTTRNNGQLFSQQVVTWVNNDPYFSSRVSLPCSTTPVCTWVIQGDGFYVVDPNTQQKVFVSPWIPCNGSCK